MSRVVRGFVAGVIATMVLVVVMLARHALGLFPDLDVIPLIGAAAGELFGLPRTALTGWMLLFLIGAVWGLIFGWIYDRIAGASRLVRGLVFAVAAWAVMMVVFMPIAGAGWFGLAGGIETPVVALIMHVIFGAVMGVSFERLPHRRVARETS